MRLTFWGTRGSLPVPGPDTLLYGGNTTCLELEHQGRRIIIDAGSGIRALGAALGDDPQEATLLLTHLHWDHILGFPYFMPIYTPGTRLRVGGWPRALEGLSGLFAAGHLDGAFPVSFADLPSQVEADFSLIPPRLTVHGLTLTTIPLVHPQGAIGYRMAGPEGDVVFVTDNELPPGGRDLPGELVAFCRGARVLIHDAQYIPEEMAARRGWGHSDYAAAVALGRAAGAERLILTHHEPARSDGQVDALVERARDLAGERLMVEAAREGLVVEI